MALQSERDELLASWRALAGHPAGEGWRTIQVAHDNPCRVLAGRHFPGNEEALLVGFATTRLPPANMLPQGHGFLVSREDLPPNQNYVWVALRRQQAGRLDLFAMMAVDVLSTLAHMRGAPSERLVGVFLARISAWQEFMRRGPDGVLGPEAEVGLVGELELLKALLSTGISALAVIETWQGPLDGLHDFTLGSGAIEVKATVAHAGFTARIGSLDQLDDSLKSPLFLAGIRLALDDAGKSLPEMVDALRRDLETDPAALTTFNTLVLHAGYSDNVADRYTRRFRQVGQQFLRVREGFPRLTRGNTPAELRAARYELDLDLIPGGSSDFDDVLVQLGMSQ